MSDYDDVAWLYDGLLKVKPNSKYGFIDKTGKVMIALRYGIDLDFSKGLAIVKKWQMAYHQQIRTTNKRPSFAILAMCPNNAL